MVNEVVLRVYGLGFELKKFRVQFQELGIGVRSFRYTGKDFEFRAEGLWFTN
jgi:hypothetical protein